jgi:hypothetical protein
VDTPEARAAGQPQEGAASHAPAALIPAPASGATPPMRTSSSRSALSSPSAGGSVVTLRRHRKCYASVTASSSLPSTRTMSRSSTPRLNSLKQVVEQPPMCDRPLSAISRGDARLTSLSAARATAPRVAVPATSHAAAPNSGVFFTGADRTDPNVLTSTLPIDFSVRDCVALSGSQIIGLQAPRSGKTSVTWHQLAFTKHTNNADIWHGQFTFLNGFGQRVLTTPGAGRRSDATDRADLRVEGSLPGTSR